MSSTALAERLSAAEEKNGQLVKENRTLNALLAVVEEQLVQRKCELAAVEAQNSQLLQERRDLAERLAKGKELVCALVATVPELAPLSDGGGGGGSGGGGSDGGSGGGGIGGGGGSGGGSDGGGSECSPQRTAGNLDSSGSSTDPTRGSSVGGTPQHGEEPSAEAALQHGPATMTAAFPAAAAPKTLPIALLFPHSGCHYVKMMSGVKDIPAVKEMLEKAAAILGFDVLKLCLEGPESELAEVSHLATYIADLAGLEKLKCEREEAVTGAQVMAGLGAGQYAALAAAGVLSFEDGLKLVRLRVQIAREAAKASAPATAFIIGLNRAKVAELSAAAAKKGGSGAVCKINGEYSSLGFTVWATQKPLLVMKELAEQAGALQTMMLSEPFLLDMPPQDASQEQLSTFLEEMLAKMSPPRTTVYLAGSAMPLRRGTNPRDIAETLKRELTSPILWEPTILAMIREGVSEFYEVGLGESLKNYMRHINAKAWRTMTNIKV